MAVLLPSGLNRLEKDFFTEHDMLVVVWERHLELYLKESLVESRFGDVSVRHYDDWLNKRLAAALSPSGITGSKMEPPAWKRGSSPRRTWVSG